MRSSALLLMELKVSLPLCARLIPLASLKNTMTGYLRMTCEQRILAGFEDESLSYRPECLASRAPLPGSEEARAMTAGSGRQLSMLLDQSSPLGAFSRILLESSHWTSSQEYSYVWNRLD